MSPTGLMAAQSPRGLLGVASVLIPRSLTLAANDHLRHVGRRGCEGFALWAGKRNGAVFTVSETIIPEQSALRSGQGICVTVDGDELFRLNVHLYERELEVIAQIHSHPGEAYHSETDDTFPIATTSGAFSLVVPDFAVHPFALELCAAYRLIPGEGWAAVEPGIVEQLFTILDH